MPYIAEYAKTIAGCHRNCQQFF